jgi:hypothetical protein
VPTRLVNTPEEARREVTELAAKKPDVVKVVYDHEVYGGRSLPSIDKATLSAGSRDRARAWAQDRGAHRALAGPARCG